MKKSLVGLSLLLASCLLFLPSALAQRIPTVTLAGMVLDAESGEPLPGANVFIAGSLVGTSTGLDGSYRLTGIPAGAMRLYVSMIGYEPDFRDMLLRTEAVRTIVFELKPSVYELEGIAVEAREDKRWQRRLERFQDLFIGQTPNAQETEITNATILDFEGSGGNLRALAPEPLVIKNKGLGYQVTYFLKDFSADPRRTKYDGEPLFEEMIPSSPEEAATWAANRRTAFVGSFRHFLLALIAGRTEEQGFKTYGRTNMGDSTPGEMGGGPTAGTRFPIDAASVFKAGAGPNEYTLDFEGFVEITFTGEIEDESYIDWSREPRRRPRYQTSWIRLEKGPTTFDWKGDVLDPYGVTFYGYFAFERVADEVPREYRPS